MRTSLVATIILSCWSVANAASAAQSSDDVINVLGPGNRSCGEWTDDRRGREWVLSSVWVEGYVVGIESAWNIQFDIDPRALEAWLDSYCGAHPLDHLDLAAAKLTLELQARAKTDK